MRSRCRIPTDHPPSSPADHVSTRRAHLLSKPSRRQKLDRAKQFAKEESILRFLELVTVSSKAWTVSLDIAYSSESVKNQSA